MVLGRWWGKGEPLFFSLPLLSSVLGLSCRCQHQAVSGEPIEPLWEEVSLGGLKAPALVVTTPPAVQDGPLVPVRGRGREEGIDHHLERKRDSDHSPREPGVLSAG